MSHSPMRGSQWGAVAFKTAGVSGPLAVAACTVRLRYLADGRAGCQDGTFIRGTVGIRSATVEERTARLFAGVGILADSEPTAERRKSQLKLHAMLGVLDRPQSPAACLLSRAVRKGTSPIRPWVPKAPGSELDDDLAPHSHRLTQRLYGGLPLLESVAMRHEE